MIVGTYFRTDLTDTKLSFYPIRSFTIYVKFQVQLMEVGRSHLCRPPQPRAGNIQLGKFLRFEGDILRLTRSQLYRLGKFDSLNPTLERASHRLLARVF